MTSKNQASSVTKYNVSITLLLVFSVIFILGVWIWFDNKNDKIDQEISNIIKH